MTDPEAVLDALAAHIHEPQTVAVQGLSKPRVCRWRAFAAARLFACLAGLSLALQPFLLSAGAIGGKPI